MTLLGWGKECFRQIAPDPTVTVCVTVTPFQGNRGNYRSFRLEPQFYGFFCDFWKPMNPDESLIVRI